MKLWKAAVFLSKWRIPTWKSLGSNLQAIRLRPDFDRACYNLGTVFYAHACSRQSSITQRLPSSLTKVGVFPLKSSIPPPISARSDTGSV